VVVEQGRHVPCSIQVSGSRITIRESQNLPLGESYTISSIENRSTVVVFHTSKWDIHLNKRSYKTAKVVEVRKSPTLIDAMVSVDPPELSIAFPNRRIETTVKDINSDLRYSETIYQCLEANGNYWKVYVKK
jgi:hypothetical protein